MKKNLSKFIAIAIGCQLLAVTYSNAQTGKWTALTNLEPNNFNGGLTLLTDGRVLCHNVSGSGNGTGWDMLTPDSTGSYANGTWSSIAPMNYDRLYFSTQVLPSGKVYVAGGEYGAGTYYGEVYDPVANTWTICGNIPNGWLIYDGNSEILYDGTILEGPQIGSNSSYNILRWSPNTLNYAIGPDSYYNHDEAAWLKLPDSSVLFVGIASDYANRYIPQTSSWVYDATVGGNLYDPNGEEAGGALMLPNGQAVFFGATAYNAIYTPTGNSSPGTWTTVDSFPIVNGYYLGQPDAPSAMMVNGHILCSASPIGTSSGEFASPCYFVEYDYTTNTFTQVKDPIPGFSSDSLPAACYQTNMLDLPDGNVLVANYQQSFSNQHYVYTPGSGPIAQGKPTIDNIIADSCPNYIITGKLFNGISEGATYGDDWQMETNFPIVRLTNGTRVYYAKTSNWNRIGAVQTDSLEDTAMFTLPANIPTGTYSLVVVVNGFASSPVLFSVFGASIAPSSDLCYGDSTGSIAATVIGGLPPFTYQWLPSGGSNNIASGLSAGTYTLNVSDKSGCTKTEVATIGQPSAPVSGILSGSNAACNNSKDGFSYVIASGGISPYTYLWNNGKTTSSISGLSAGIYSVTITDHNGCTEIIKDTVTQPKPMNVHTDSVNVTSAQGCNGVADAIVSGGTAPYTYKWSPGGQTTDTIKNLCTGTYCCNITDANGCTEDVCVVVKFVSGIENITYSSEINVYPDPNNGYFTVTGIIRGEVVELYNYMGQMLSSTIALDGSLHFDISNNANGIYLVRIINKDGSVITQRKIIKAQ